MLKKISSVIQAGLSIVETRNERQLTKRMILEYIKPKDEQKEIEDIFGEKYYIAELDNDQLLKLYEKLKDNPIFLKNNLGIIRQNPLTESKKTTREKLVKSLSWSKIYSWKNNKKQFIKTYFEKQPFFETKEIVFGSALGTMIELQEYNDEDKIVTACMTWNGELQEDKRKEGLLRTSIDNIKSNKEFIEKLQELEFDLFSEYENRFQDFIDGVCTLGFSDNCSQDWKGLKEFKTGKTPWTSERVNDHGQLDLYCLLTYLKKGYLPDDVELIWFPTAENSNGEIIPTGEIKTFKFDVEENKKRILDWKEKIPKIFAEIQEAQAEWENQKNIEDDSEFSDKELFEAYEIQKKINELTEELKEKKLVIEERLKAGNLKDYKLEGIGSVYYMQRKKYEYPEDLIRHEADLKKVKKEFEETATPTISESIAFRFNK